MNLTTSRTVLGFLLPCALICQGCTSFKAIDYDAAVSAVEQVHEGNRVRVIDVFGQQLDFTLTGVDDEHIDGRTSDGVEVRIEMGQVREIERRQRSRGKTAALTGGLAVFYVMCAGFFGAPL